MNESINFTENIILFFLQHNTKTNSFFNDAGGMLSDLAPQELQVSQLEHYDGSTLRRDAESALFAIPLSLSRHRYSSKETLRAVLDARCIVDGSIQEAARWPTECQVKLDALVRRHLQESKNWYQNHKNNPLLFKDKFDNNYLNFLRRHYTKNY